ncbi:KGK domain-containing protein [Oscillatoria sp. FACHB-1407]|uniref:KGK domain-containing protein n=1 Tax=Oscillatoria sp. FACHB-1407 TaxID=2692847 RepID=UPI001684F1FB|nr:KGK domain-containing protein [Oscillatoria sp. FACHB-1407]MBD2462252.1 KGK domain-containing protein [Oscillatoria sp. FACHB-1407]
MENEFAPLNDDEVLYIREGRVLIPNPTFKVVEFLDALAQAVSEREDEWTEDSEGWFGSGLPCEVLRFGNQGWQRGRVRIRLEFCPEKQPKLLREQPPTRDREQPYRRNSREDVYPPRSDREDIYSRQDRDVYVQPDDFYEDDADVNY